MAGSTLKVGVARHETFHLRDGWLYKGLNSLSDDTTALSQVGVHHSLGLGTNMLKSMVYWMQASGLVTPQIKTSSTPTGFELTEFATELLENDPFLEDPATLWLLHIGLVTNKELATFWYWAFNLFNQREFSEERLQSSFKDYLAEIGFSKIAESSIQKDARCFLRTYLPRQPHALRASVEDTLDCPLTSLDLIRTTPLGDKYRFHFGTHRSINLWVFAYALFRFKQNERAQAITISMEELRWSPGSPGRVLCLDAANLADYVDGVTRLGLGIQLTRTAGLNQISFKSLPLTGELLKNCFGKRGGQNDLI